MPCCKIAPLNFAVQKDRAHARLEFNYQKKKKSVNISIKIRFDIQNNHGLVPPGISPHYYITAQVCRSWTPAQLQGDFSHPVPGKNHHCPCHLRQLALTPKLSVLSQNRAVPAFPQLYPFSLQLVPRGAEAGTCRQQCPGQLQALPAEGRSGSAANPTGLPITKPNPASIPWSTSLGKAPLEKSGIQEFTPFLTFKSYICVLVSAALQPGPARVEMA